MFCHAVFRDVFELCVIHVDNLCQQLPPSAFVAPSVCFTSCSQASSFSTTSSMPKNMSAEALIESAEADQARLDKKRAKAKRAMINSLLDEHPDFDDDVIELLHRLKKRRTGQAVEVQRSPAPRPSQDEFVWFTQYNKYMVTPSKLVMKCLEACHRIVFSYGNLKMLMGPGQREPNNVTLSKYLEFATDRPMDLFIEKTERNLEVQLGLCARHAKQNRIENLLLGSTDVEDKDGIL